jgi:hypothetical protein
MGHFSHSCKLTGIPITGGTPVVLIVMKHGNDLYDNSEKSLKRFGKTYMCSNEGTRLKYMPCWFPIHGEYDEYGGIENIVKDDNTEILEKYYGLTIEEIMGVITSGRKDDGYDESLKIIKKPIQRPADQLEGENHHQYYGRIMNDPMPCDGRYPISPNNELQIWRGGKYVKATKEQYDADFKLIHEQYARYNKWKETNPDVEDDYGKPEYEDRYKELLTYSGMWVHGDVYNQLTESQIKDEYNKLDFGRPEVLKALGFVEGEKTKAERYNRPFTHGKLTLMSDGNWVELNVENFDDSLYTISQFKKLAKFVGEDIDFSPIEGKDKLEQIYDVVIPTLNFNDEASTLVDIFENGSKEDFQNYIKKLGIDVDNEEGKKAVQKLIRDSLKRMGGSREEMELYYYFLNTERFSNTRITNPMTTEYLKAAKEGKIKDNLLRFWRFDHYMFVCGRYYEIVGTAPQDGEHKDVLRVLTIAKSVLEEVVKARYDGDDEEDNE